MKNILKKEGGEDLVRVSKHAKQRLKERCGLNKKAVQRMAETAFEKGVRQEETCGQLNKWFTTLFFVNSAANNIRIYGNFAYIFCDNTLVTVLSVPKRLQKQVQSQNNKKKMQQDNKPS